MKLGLMSAAFPNLSLEEIAKWASENGFEMLELACWPTGQSRPPLCRASPTLMWRASMRAKAKSILEMLKKYNLPISALGYYPNPMEPDLEHRKYVIDHLKKVIVAAGLLNVPVVGTFIGND